MGKERTLYYRRVKWSAVGPHNLQKYVDRAHRRLNTTALRTFVYNEGQIQGINFKHERKPGLSLIHVTYYGPPAAHFTGAGTCSGATGGNG